MSNQTRYCGVIASVPGRDGFGFIDIRSLTKEDGSIHDLPTDKDVFLHQDECGSPIQPGMTVSFGVVPDTSRGDGTFRAVAAIEVIEAEMLPAGEEPIRGLTIVAPEASRALAVYRHPMADLMKQVPEETVERVAANQPLPGLPRDLRLPDDDAAKQALLEDMLERMFPSMHEFGADFRITDHDDGELEELLRTTQAGMERLGMRSQLEMLRDEVSRFRSVRSAFTMMWEEGALRPDTVLPIRYLPDLFMAVPVWYYWMPDQASTAAEQTWEENDPLPHAVVKDFCDLFPNPNWYDTFQMFNRRVRTLTRYKGEIIPPPVVRRIVRSVEIFDRVVIMTPYHDEAGKDWEDLAWLRAIDPYVIGFKNRFPWMFVLGRYSGTGVLPLYHELVADTIEFLRTNKQRLEGFNRVPNPYWYQGRSADGCRLTLGSYLMAHTDRLLAAFEAGRLFDWLRGEVAITSPAAR